MSKGLSSRTSGGLLVLLLVAPLLVFAPAASAADPSLRVVNANTGASYATIQAALSAAAAGDTITVPMGLDPANPATYDEAITIATTGVTLCATVAVATCADHVDAARWSTSTGTWGTPPTPRQGQAINVGALGSTSHFPNTQNPLNPGFAQIEDIDALSFDFLLAAGSCTSGGLRAQIGLNSTGTGTTKDRTLFLNPVPISPACPVGQWVHYDLLAAQNWGLNQIGGPSVGGTQAQAQSLAGAVHRVVSFNAIFDGAPAGTVGWFDNVRFNNAFYREAADEQCIDPEQPSCIDADARSGTILDAAGSSTATVTISAADVTLRGFTIKNTGAGIAQGVRINGADALVEKNDILGNPAEVLNGALQIGVVQGAPGAFMLANNTILDWAHSGVYLSSDSPGLRTIADNNIQRSGVNAILLEGGTPSARVDILRNDLQQARNSNVRINASNEVHMNENVLGVSQFTIDLYRFGYTGVHIDATRNHWGAYSRATIQDTIGDLQFATVDVSCYYEVDGVSTVCAPTASFSTAVGNTWPRVVTLSDTSTFPSNEMESRLWTLSDGATSTTSTNAVVSLPLTPGSYAFTLDIEDTEGFTSSATSSLLLANTAPVFSLSGPYAATEGALLSFPLGATDAESDTLAYTLLAGPSGMSVAGGVLSWTPGFATAPGTYPFTVRVTDGNLDAAASSSVVVSDVPAGAPIGAIANVNMLELQSATRSVTATSPSGSSIVLSVPTLPPGATFTDNGNGQGTFAIAAPSASAGTYTVTVEAVSEGLTTTKTFSVVITKVVGLTLERLSPTTVQTSPGQVVALSARVTNTGSGSDTMKFSMTSSRAWPIVLPANALLAAGANAVVDTLVTIPAGADAGFFTLKACSTTTPTLCKTVLFRIEVPLVLSLDMESAFGPLDEINGTVYAKYLDNAPASGISVTFTERHQQNLWPLTSGVSGTTDATGAFVFVDAHPMATLLGGHVVLVSAEHGDLDATLTDSYDVGP